MCSDGGRMYRAHDSVKCYGSGANGEGEEILPRKVVILGVFLICGW